MSTVIEVTTAFQGPFPASEIGDRAAQFGGCITRAVSEGRWFEAFVHFDRLNDAAPTALTAELLAQVFAEVGLNGEISLDRLGECAPDSHGRRFLRIAGEFCMGSRVTALAYIDARLLPAAPADFTVESASYGSSSSGTTRTAVFAPARLATILRTTALPSPACVATHAGTLYVGCAGRYSNKDGGLFRLGEDGPHEITLARKAPKVYALLSDGDSLYVGASNGLHRLQGDTVVQSWTSRTGLAGRDAVALAKHEGRIFVGSAGGYAWLAGDALETHKENRFKNAEHVCKAPDGKLWVGSKNGLHFAAPGSHYLQPQPSYRGVSAMAATRDGLYASLFYGNNPRSVHLTDTEETELCRITPVASMGGYVLIHDFHGLTRADRGETAQRIFFEHTPHSYAVVGERLFGFCDDRLLEIDPASFERDATVSPPTMHSPALWPRSAG